MLKRKKILSLLLVSAMATSLLAGCGSQNEKTESKESAVQSQEKVEEKPADQSQEKAEEEPIVIKALAIVGADDGDWNDYWYFTYLEEKFNVDFQIEMISSEADVKIPLLFASDDLPDLFLNSLSNDQIDQYGSEGFLLDMTSYLSEETTPNLWAILGEQPDFISAMTNLDGQIYALRGMDMSVHNQNVNRFYLNYDWSEQILGKNPETLDEFYDYLVAVKEEDMNGNGDPNDEIPLGGRYGDPEAIHAFTAMLNAFGFTRMEVEAINGEVVYVPAAENYKHFLEFMHKLYEEELLDPEFFTQTEEQRNAKDADYRYGAVGNYINSMNQPELDISLQYELMEPITSEYNSEKMVAAHGVNLYGALSITKECEHPEKIVEMYDWMLTPEGTVGALFGPELGTWEGYEDYGIEYQLEDNVFSFTETMPAEYETNGKNWYRDKVCPSSGTVPIYRNFRQANVGHAYYIPDDTAIHLEPYFVVNWPKAMKYTTDELEQLALITTDITSYKDEMVTKMITGEVSIDSFDEYVQGLKDRGLDKYLEVHQTAYDRFTENK